MQNGVENKYSKTQPTKISTPTPTPPKSTPTPTPIPTKKSSTPELELPSPVMRTLTLEIFSANPCLVNDLFNGADPMIKHHSFGPQQMDVNLCLQQLSELIENNPTPGKYAEMKAYIMDKLMGINSITTTDLEEFENLYEGLNDLLFLPLNLTAQEKHYAFQLTFVKIKRLFERLITELYDQRKEINQLNDQVKRLNRELNSISFIRLLNNVCDPLICEIKGFFVDNRIDLKYYNIDLLFDLIDNNRQLSELNDKHYEMVKQELEKVAYRLQIQKNDLVDLLIQRKDRNDGFIGFPRL
ncbi:unnamed protein product [Didymodactylos carnosus]|uniref:Uncharacterized protein n=1 Tax=Didymodactylos carnosus TaxID=1234261 RepID=A0A814YUL1_9BILA|nr:unnamed protein product [Didymodactylos carnosus]CAF3998266.1 unnamed protein product [Didymodactylos carnosus]